MSALALLDFAWCAINVIYVLCLLGIVAGGLWFIGACAAARAEDQRAEHIWHHPSNVTLLPRPRPFDHEVDA